MHIFIVLAWVALALVASAAPAAAAERQCGVVTGVGLGDLTSGGGVSIDGRHFLVGGVGPRNVDLSAAGQLRVGTHACAEGEFRVFPDGAVDLYNGRIFVNTAGLPSTSTGDGIDACGPISGFSTSNGRVLSFGGEGGNTYRLLGNGTVPDALGALSTGLNPEHVRLVGRAGTDPGTVTDYTVTRVASCSTLPNTSTEPVTPWHALLLALAALLAGITLAPRARTRTLR